MKKSFDWRWLGIMVLMITTMACGGQKKNITEKRLAEPQKLNIKPADESNSKIAFITFNVALTDSIKNEYSFSIKDSKFVDGVLKGTGIVEQPTVERNYLYCQLSNKEGEVSNWVKVQDPLSTEYEYPGDGNGDLGKTVLKRKTGEVMLRFQWNSKLNYISIYRASQNSVTLNKIYYAVF